MVEFNPDNYQEQNPLKQFFRQAKVYITLPSQGKFYPEGALDMPETGELPVYAMTAKDELTFKTPDALLNGQATVNVIQSCVPNIKNAWAMPSIDLDAILIAIRIATYGENMDITTKVPGTGEERDFTVDLRLLLNKLVTVDFQHVIKLKNMIVEIRPLTYKEFTESSMKTFEEQRIFQLVNDESIPDSEKLAKFNQSFSKLTDLTVSVLTNSITKISIGDTVVTNPVHIKEFVDNTDKEFYKNITEHLEEQRKKFQIEPIKVSSSDEDIEKGAPKEYKVPITFDQSNFFA
jgi:hypothetical protein